MAANGAKKIGSTVNSSPTVNHCGRKQKTTTFVGEEHQFLMIQPTSGLEDRLFDRFRVVVVFLFPAQPIFNS
jgi:hypothetical protein